MPTRKRIRSSTPAVSGGGGGGPTPGGTVAWGPDFGGDNGDRFSVGAAVDVTELALAGDTSVGAAVDMPTIALSGALTGASAVDMPELALSGALTAGAAIDGSYIVQDMLADEDTYLDEGSPTTANGAATALLCKTNAAVGNNEQITYVAWDLTGMSGTVSSATIDVEIATSQALGENATFEWYTHGSKPFEEDTATWNGDEQPPGTARGTTAQAVTTTATVYTVTLPSAVRSNMMGNWFYFRMQGTTALGLATITVTSKEGTNKPTLTYTVDM